MCDTQILNQNIYDYSLQVHLPGGCNFRLQYNLINFKVLVLLLHFNKITELTPDTQTLDVSKLTLRVTVTDYRAALSDSARHSVWADTWTFVFCALYICCKVSLRFNPNLHSTHSFTLTFITFFYFLVDIYAYLIPTV